jgi:dienelactone hydrolase
MNRHCLQVLVAVLCLGFIVFDARADTPAPIPASDFAKHSPYGVPSMSPDGQYLAVSVHEPQDADNGAKFDVGVFHLPDMKPVSRIEMPAAIVPMQIAWISDTRFIVITAIEIGALDAPVRDGAVIAMNYDATHQQTMLKGIGHQVHIGAGGGDSFGEEFGGLPAKLNGHFYWMLSHGRFGIATEGRSELYDVDGDTGKTTLIGRVELDGMNLFAHDGVARIAYGMDEKGKAMLLERDSADQPWHRINTSAHSVIPLRISDDGTHVYWKYSADGGPYVLAVSNFDLSDMKVLASDPFGSIGEVFWTPSTHKPFAAIVDTGRPKTIYVDDDDSATIHKALSQQFPDLLIRFVSISDDSSRILVHADSDKNPGLFALFTLNPVTFTPLFRVAPWIDPARMASRVPIRFAATDGTSLDGYLTLPPRGSKFPLVLLPHGGPIGIRDQWDYDAWSQFLASRGYAVLQVNYRGSAGRGPGFLVAGYKQFATGIQQDLLDGVHWAIAQGYADKDRVCVFGASFGGYSALMAPIRAPGVFKCSIDFAGISDYRIEQDDSDTAQTDRGRSYFSTAVGSDDASIKAASPIDHLDAFNVPVLIVHGEKDPRVPLKNATELRDALAKADKPYEWLVKPKELHGFYSEADNTDLLQHMQDFLAKYLGS